MGDPTMDGCGGSGGTNVLLSDSDISGKVSSSSDNGKCSFPVRFQLTCLAHTTDRQHKKAWGGGFSLYTTYNSPLRPPNLPIRAYRALFGNFTNRLDKKGEWRCMLM